MTEEAEVRWRVGTVPYLVARPLTYGLADHPQIDLVEAPPSELAVLLHAGKLDVALASSVLALGETPLKMWTQGPVIASDGPIHSVLLFLAPGIEHPKDVRRWYADPFSRTGRRLTSWLMKRAWQNDSAECLEVPEGVDAFDHAIATQVDAVQLIGDPAILAHQANPQWKAIDLGCAWKETAQKPFVFAGWMQRKGFQVGPLGSILEAAAEIGLGKRQVFAQQAAAGDDAQEAFLTQYLCEDLRYKLRPAEVIACLEEFRVS